MFDDVLRPDTDVDVTHLSRVALPRREGRAIARSSSTRSSSRLYGPVVRAVMAVADVVRRGHTGSVHAYLGYGAIGLLVVLVVAR